MASEKSGASYRWLTITLLAAAGMYAWYAISQYGRLNDLNQRQLSNAAAELKTTLTNAAETVRRFNEKWTPEQAHESFRALCKFDSDQPYLDYERCAANPEKLSWAKFGEDEIHIVTEPSLGIQAISKGDKRVHFAFRTDKLLQELAFPDSFGLIFIADGNGKVLYQEAPTQRRWLRHLRWGERTFRDAQADRPPTLQIRDVSEVLGGKEQWSRLRSTSSRTSLQVGGIWHQVYLQPLLLQNGGKNELFVGGAVPTKVIVSDALALDTIFVGVLVFLLLLGVLGFPFIKLAFLDSHERFRLLDVNLLYLSTGALLVLFSCAALALDGYVRWQAAADEGLQKFAGDLEWRFRQEVAAIRDQLVEYDDQLRRETGIDCEAWKIDTEWFADQKHTRLAWPERPIHLRQVSWIRPDGRQMWKSTSDAIQGRSWVDERPYFRAVRDNSLYMIREGKRLTGPAIFLGPDRSVANGKFYTFVSTMSALTSDECPGLKAFSAGPIVVASAQLSSLDRQPLPAGYGFVVVNRDGRVLYHSDRRLSLRENFFEELRESARARAITYAGHADALDSRYRERPHAFYLHPIDLYRAGEQERAGLYIVAFRETSAERALVAHAFVTGLFGPMLLLFVIYAAGLWGLALVSRFGGRHWSAWLWPHGGLNPVYIWQTIAFSILLIGGLGLYLKTRHIEIFLVMPVLAAALGSAICLAGNHASDARRRLSSPLWHTLALVLALACMIVAPSWGLFRLALSQEFAKLILTERTWIDGQKADAVRETEVDALTEHYGSAWNERHRDVRWAAFACVPPPYDVALPGPPIHQPERGEPDLRRAAYRDGGAESVVDATATRSVDSMVRCVPDPNDASAVDERLAELRKIEASFAVVHALHWFDDVLSPNDMLARQRFTRFGNGDFGYSPDGTLLRGVRVSVVVLVFVPALVGLLVWWIRWNTNRLFFANEQVDAAAAEGPFEQMWEQLEIEEKLALLQIRRERIANPYQRRVVNGFLEKGLLRLNPELQPYSEEFRRFLEDKDRQLCNDLHCWEEVRVGHSWRYVRLILVASLVGLGFFLIATQPALQSSLVALATGTTGVLTTGLKLRDAIASWIGNKTS